MALESWDWFAELAETGNFTKAAENLQISQQALSARLAALEKDVDAKLFVRSVPLALTPAGMAFLLYVREQRQAQRDMLRQIGEATGSGAGTLKVGVSLMRGRLIMPRVIRALTEKMPEICVHLAEGTNRELLRMAEQGEVDAVIARFGGNRTDIKVTPLYEEEVVLAVRTSLLEKATGMSSDEAAKAVAKHGLRLLEGCPFVMGTVDDISGRIAYSELRNAGISPKVVATSESIVTLLAMAAEGLGAVFTPVNAPELSRAAERGIALVPLSSKAKYTISLGIPPRTEPWYATSVFKEVLLDSLKGDGRGKPRQSSGSNQAA